MTRDEGALNVEVALLTESHEVNVPAVRFDHVQMVSSEYPVDALVVRVATVFASPIRQGLDEVGDVLPVGRVGVRIEAADYGEV